MRSRGFDCGLWSNIIHPSLGVLGGYTNANVTSVHIDVGLGLSRCLRQNMYLKGHTDRPGRLRKDYLHFTTTPKGADFVLRHYENRPVNDSLGLVRNRCSWSANGLGRGQSFEDRHSRDTIARRNCARERHEQRRIIRRYSLRRATSWTSPIETS